MKSELKNSIKQTVLSKYKKEGYADIEELEEIITKLLEAFESEIKYLLHTSIDDDDELMSYDIAFPAFGTVKKIYSSLDGNKYEWLLKNSAIAEKNFGNVYSSFEGGPVESFREAIEQAHKSIIDDIARDIKSLYFQDKAKAQAKLEALAETIMG